MKKLVFILLFLFGFSFPACALPSISDDFYLHNGSVFETEAINILPDTLRVVMQIGEVREINADTIPQWAENELNWQIVRGEGVVDIYPHGKDCTVIGVKEGEAEIEINGNGASRRVSAAVKAAKQIKLRSFDYKEDVKRKSRFSEELMRNIIRLLITSGAIMLFASIIVYLKNRRTRDNEDEK